MNHSYPYPGLFYWLPRISGVALAVFFAFFTGNPRFEYLQLIPALFIVAVLIISWANDLAGFIGFFVLGIAAAVFFSTFNKTEFAALLTAPLFLVSLLYLKSFFDSRNKTSST